MVNPLNNGIFAGHLAADPKVFDNKDGSRTVKITVYALDNFRKRDGSRGSQRIQFDRYIEAGQDLGIYQYLTTGMAVVINYTLKSNSYVDKNTGEKVWSEFQSINSITPNESKTVSDERRARNAAANQGAQNNQGAPVQQNNQGVAANQDALGQFFGQQFNEQQFGQPAQAPVAGNDPWNVAAGAAAGAVVNELFSKEGY